MIRPEYRPLVRENARFWNASGVSVEAGLTSFRVQVGQWKAGCAGGWSLPCRSRRVRKPGEERGFHWPTSLNPNG